MPTDSGKLEIIICRNDGTSNLQMPFTAIRGGCEPGVGSKLRANRSELPREGRKAKKGGTAKACLSSLYGMEGFFIF
jgi:hypothetical protein